MPICANQETVNLVQMAPALSSLAIFSYVAQMEFPLNLYFKKVTLSGEE